MATRILGNVCVQRTVRRYRVQNAQTVRHQRCLQQVAAVFRRRGGIQRQEDNGDDQRSEHNRQRFGAIGNGRNKLGHRPSSRR